MSIKNNINVKNIITGDVFVGSIDLELVGKGDYPLIELSSAEFNSIQLKKLKLAKKTEINNLRDKLLNLDSPHDIGFTYILEIGGESVRFQVSEQTRIAIQSVLLDLVEGETEEWIATDNKTYQLTLADFKALNKHLKDRSTALRKNAREAKDIIEAIVPSEVEGEVKTIEDCIAEIEAFDINVIAIY